MLLEWANVKFFQLIGYSSGMGICLQLLTFQHIHKTSSIPFAEVALAIANKIPKIQLTNCKNLKYNKILQSLPTLTNNGI